MSHLQRLRSLFIPALAIALAAIINYCWLINAYVPSESMIPNIPKHSMVLGLRNAYKNSQPRNGDIIFFRHGEVGNNLLVKRVIATPGQIVEVQAGRVYIDGQLLEEYYLKEFSEEDFGPLLVPENSCFVLGDNRKFSKDSRYWHDPFVNFANIEGKAIWLWFPKIKRLD